MFEGRFNHFVCDGCGLKVKVHKFPEGWCTTRPIQHHCKECRKKLPKGTKIWEEGAKEDECQKIK